MRTNRIWKTERQNGLLSHARWILLLTYSLTHLLTYSLTAAVGPGGGGVFIPGGATAAMLTNISAALASVVAAGTNGITITTNAGPPARYTVHFNGQMDFLSVLNLYATNTYTLITNATGLATDGNGKLILGSGISAGVTNQWKIDATNAAAGQTIYASNLVSGGTIPVGTLFSATTNGNQGGFLLETIGSTRYRTYNGALLTNLPPGSLSSTVTTNAATLTSGRVQVGDGGRGVANATASGAVPIDADGTATTLVQLQTLGVASATAASNPFTNSVIGYGDAQRTNAITISASGVTVSNTLGNVQITSGTITNTGAIQSTNTGQANTSLTLNGAATGAVLVMEYKTNNSALFKVANSGIVTAAEVDTVSAAANSPGLYVTVTADSFGRIVAAINSSGVPFLGFGPGNVGRDVAVMRNSAGVLEINSTTAGTLRDLILRTIQATNGIQTLRSNLLAPTSITVGASPFSWTNTLGVNAMVFVDATAATVSAIAVNGQQVLGGITGGATLPLQGGEYWTVTYTVAPTARWKPF